MVSDINIGNFCGPGFVRTEFNRYPWEPVEQPKPAKATEGRQEFESVLGTIMGVVRQFPEVLERVVAALQAEKARCPI